MIKILIADDEKNIRLGIIKILSESFDLEIAFHEAKNGEDALEKTQSLKPDILITDIRMPKMDGIELMRLVREKNAAIPIVVLSGYDEFSYAQKAITYQAASYILKPIDREELKSVLTKIIKGLPAAAGGARSFIKAALEWIDQHFTEDISMAEAANHVSVNYSYFSQKFSEETGLHFTKYVKRARIQYAMKLLASGNYHVYEAALKSGYRDVKYFLRSFKEIAGMTPGEYSKSGASIPDNIDE
jgi:two-component system response regulator YesN